MSHPQPMRWSSGSLTQPGPWRRRICSSGSPIAARCTLSSIGSPRVLVSPPGSAKYVVQRGHRLDLASESPLELDTPCLWREGVTSECIHFPGFGAFTPKSRATPPSIGPVEGCARTRVGGTLGGSKRGNFLDAVQNLCPSRVSVDDLPDETGVKAARCALWRLRACDFLRGLGALILSMTSLAAEAAPHWLSARLCLVVPRQAAIAPPLHAGVD